MNLLDKIGNLDNLILEHEPDIKINTVIIPPYIGGGYGIRVFDAEQTNKYYLYIDYDKDGNIIYYEDYLGNWYDSDTFTTPCYYTYETVLIPTPWENLILPIAISVVSRTIASELISVQAMDAPKVNLYYYDYVYTPNEPEI